MIKPFSIIVHALRLWWRDWIGMIMLNILWFALQIPIVTGPPATAVLYATAQRSYEDEYRGMPEIWPLLRDLFWPAWRWALPNGVFLGIMVVNLYAYQSATGTGWLLLRLLWGMLLATWLALNLFYWPFWLNQKDKSLWVTYMNCGRFILLNPLPAIILVFFCIALMVASVLITIPLATGAVCLLALVGIAAVKNSLIIQKEREKDDFSSSKIADR